MLLTDNDIEDVWDPAEVPWDEVDPKGYARVVEAKVLAKLQNQAPMAFVKDNPYCPEGTSDELSTYLPVGTKLYAAPQPAVPHGWRFVRRPDGIGIYAPPPKLGESPRTSDTVPVSNRDLYDLLGKLADQQAAPEAPAQGEHKLKWCYACGEGVTTFCRGKTDACPMFKKAPAQPSVSARWSETVKVLREALQDALMLLEAYCDEGEVATRAQARAAIALADRLEGGE